MSFILQNFIAGKNNTLTKHLYQLKNDSMTLCMLQVGEQIEESYVKKHSDAPLLLLISNKTLSCKTFQKGMNSPPPQKKKMH